MRKIIELKNKRVEMKLIQFEKRTNFSRTTDLTVPKGCARFVKNRHHMDHSRPIVYLRLLSDGCEKERALSFAARPVCKYDSTRMVDGPACFRTLRPHEKSDGYYSSINGWIPQRPGFNMGKKYCASVKEIFTDAYTYDQGLVQHFHEHENKIKETYKEKLRLMQKYYIELQETCHIKGQDNEEIKKKGVWKSSIDGLRQKLGLKKAEKRDFMDLLQKMYERETSANEEKEKDQATNRSQWNQEKEKSSILIKLDECEEFTNALRNLIVNEIEEGDKGIEVQIKKTKKSLFNPVTSRTQNLDTRASSILIKKSKLVSDDFNELAYKYKKQKDEQKKQSDDHNGFQSQKLEIKFIENSKGLEKIISEYSTGETPKDSWKKNEIRAPLKYEFLDKLISSQDAIRKKLFSSKFNSSNYSCQSKKQTPIITPFKTRGKTLVDDIGNLNTLGSTVSLHKSKTVKSQKRDQPALDVFKPNKVFKPRPNPIKLSINSQPLRQSSSSKAGLTSRSRGMSESVTGLFETNSFVFPNQQSLTKVSSTKNLIIKTFG